MINLSDLSLGMPGLTPSVGMAHAEAGAVSLEAQGHTRGKTMEIIGTVTTRLSVHWAISTEQARATWADPEVATEWGAVGIAILLVKKYKNYTVLQRSRKGTGFDYWVGRELDTQFQNFARLEVSGIQNGGSTCVKKRVGQKLEQIQVTDDIGLPGVVVIVEFGSPLAEVRDK